MIAYIFIVGSTAVIILYAWFIAMYAGIHEQSDYNYNEFDPNHGLSQNKPKELCLESPEFVSSPSKKYKLITWTENNTKHGIAFTCDGELKLNFGNYVYTPFCWLEGEHDYLLFADKKNSFTLIDLIDNSSITLNSDYITDPIKLIPSKDNKYLAIIGYFNMSNGRKSDLVVYRINYYNNVPHFAKLKSWLSFKYYDIWWNNNNNLVVVAKADYDYTDKKYHFDLSEKTASWRKTIKKDLLVQFEYSPAEDRTLDNVFEVPLYERHKYT